MGEDKDFKVFFQGKEVRWAEDIEIDIDKLSAENKFTEEELKLLKEEITVQIEPININDLPEELQEIIRELRELDE